MGSPRSVARVTARVRAVLTRARGWTRIPAWGVAEVTGTRPDAVRAAFLEVLAGKVAPHEAHILSMRAP